MELQRLILATNLLDDSKDSSSNPDFAALRRKEAGFNFIGSANKNPLRGLNMYPKDACQWLTQNPFEPNTCVG